MRDNPKKEDAPSQGASQINNNKRLDHNYLPSCCQEEGSHNGESSLNGSSPPGRAAEYLTQRGISLEDAAWHGLELKGAEVSSEEYQEALNFDTWNAQSLSQIIQESIWIPHKNAGGELQSLSVRTFPNDSGSTLPKFIGPKDLPSFPFVPAQTWAMATKISVPLLFVEGPIKAIAAVQAGAYPIAVNGVWQTAASNGENGLVELHPTLAENFVFRGRVVHLAFDVDFQTNCNVRRALVRTFLILLREGAVVQILTWAPSIGKGLDDFLVRGGHLQDLDKSACGLPNILQPTDLDLVVAELKRVLLPPTKLSQICKSLAPILKCSVSALEKEVRGAQSEAGADRKTQRYQEDVEPAEEPVDGTKLFTNLCGFLHRLVVLEGYELRAIVLWIFFTYVFSIFSRAPILRIKSPSKRCGKTTLVDAIGELVNRPLRTIDTSAPALYRIAARDHPTVLADEADLSVKGDDDLLAVLNGGFDKNCPVIRWNYDCDTEEVFDVFGPRVLSGIGELAATLEDRSIIINMKRKPPNISVMERSDIDPDGDTSLALRRQIQRWVDDNLDALKSTKLTRPQSLVDREWDKWRPLLTIAKLIGDQCFNDSMRVAHFMARQDNDPVDVTVEILKHLRSLFETKKNQEDLVPTDEIINYLNHDKEAPWADWKNAMTPKTLGGKLKAHKIKSDRPSINGKRVCGYRPKDFKSVFTAYLGAQI